MTQPTVIYFGPDGGPKEGVERKVFLRTLLYSTAKRGQIIETMFVRLKRGESSRTLNIWAYGDGDKLLRGSGVYVGSAGFACNHHFLPPADTGHFEFLPGDYEMTVFAKIVGRKYPIKLNETRLTLTEQQANAVRTDDSGIYFDWGPDSQKYVPLVRDRPKAQLPNVSK